MQTSGTTIEDTTNPSGRPVRSRTTTDLANDPELWRQPSIRIRRLPSSQSITGSRQGSVGNSGLRGEGQAGRPRSLSNETQDPSSPGLTVPPTISGPSDEGSIPRKPLPSHTRHLSIGGPSTRTRSASGSNQSLRRENRSVNADRLQTRRNRSISDPPRLSSDGPDAFGPAAEGSHMPSLPEGAAPTTTNLERPTISVLPPDDEVAATGVPLGRRLSQAAGQTYARFFPTLNTLSRAETEVPESRYESELVNVLDTIDPEVATLSTLTNVQNSLFVPDLGRYLNRRPTYTLSRHTSRAEEPPIDDAQVIARRGSRFNAEPTIDEEPKIQDTDAEGDEYELVEQSIPATRTYTSMSLTSHLDDDHFAVLPHGERLEGWTEEEKAELNDHVRHLLHSRKEKFKRGMKGFGQYVRKPLGFFVTLYATLITLFGLAWVLFLIGWISVGNRKDYIVNVIDNVLVALFAIMGDGLAPFRAVDTYHMCFIAHYHHLTWRLRREQNLPKLQNHNDLPSEQPLDLEASVSKEGQFSVLNAEQQKRLDHHQKKFSRSHTFYKPHETSTHFAFPLRLLVAVVVLLDCHSFLQIALGTCTWAISYHVRPFALTTVILCCSITCNITAGIFITIGDHKTRKKDVLERMFRQDLTTQAMHKLEKRKGRENLDVVREKLGDDSVNVSRRTLEDVPEVPPEEAVQDTERPEVRRMNT